MSHRLICRSRTVEHSDVTMKLVPTLALQPDGDEQLLSRALLLDPVEIQVRTSAASRPDRAKE